MVLISNLSFFFFVNENPTTYLNSFVEHQGISKSTHEKANSTGCGIIVLMPSVLYIKETAFNSKVWNVTSI